MPRSSLQFEIQPSSGVPIYRQLMDQVRALAASGRLPAGELLPSIRQLATDLEVNMMTVSKAYARLEAEGVLERVRGTGMRISPQADRRQHAPVATRTGPAGRGIGRPGRTAGPVFVSNSFRRSHGLSGAQSVSAPTIEICDLTKSFGSQAGPHGRRSASPRRSSRRPDGDQRRRQEHADQMPLEFAASRPRHRPAAGLRQPQHDLRQRKSGWAMCRRWFISIPG